MWRRRQKDYLEEAPLLEQPPPREGITPQDIQEKEFRLAFRGYNERDVDEFLDELTEEIGNLRSESERLKRQGTDRGTERFDATAALEAQTVVRQARDEAARILAEARARAEELEAEARERATPTRASPAMGEARATGTGTPDAGAVAAYVARERQFLGTLAALIQRHAEAVKEDLRGERRSGQPTASPAPSARPADPASPQPELQSPARAPEPGMAAPRTPLPAQPRPQTPPPPTVESAPHVARAPGTTAASAMEETGGPAGEAPADAAGQRQRADDEEEEERTIRELFWGQE